MKILFDMFVSLLLNFPLMAALVALATAQSVKLVYYLVKDGKLNFVHLFEAGGMPSAHSAMASALTIAIGLSFGWTSPLFAISIIFALVVMYDAMGVRRAASKQAFILNKLVDDIYGDGKGDIEKLKEIMGHSPLEVVIGSALGIAVSALLYVLIFVL
jgi:acid phosphatase family membrane protein YuiD